MYILIYFSMLRRISILPKFPKLLIIEDPFVSWTLACSSAIQWCTHVNLTSCVVSLIPFVSGDIQNLLCDDFGGPHRISTARWQFDCSFHLSNTRNPALFLLVFSSRMGLRDTTTTTYLTVLIYVLKFSWYITATLCALFVFVLHGGWFDAWFWCYGSLTYH
jgi:hypothetical protein